MAARREVPQAVWVKHINALGRHLDAASIVPIEVGELLRSASARTGLDDFGDDGFREALATLVESLNNEAELHLVGRSGRGGPLRPGAG